MRKLFFVALAMTSMNVAANAADIPMKALPTAYDWSGFYVGGNIGGVFGRDALSSTSTFPAPNAPIDTAAVNAAQTTNLNSSGVIGGLQAGHNWQNGNLLLGVETDFTVMSLKSSSGGTFVFPSTLPGGPIGPPTQFFTTSNTMSADWLFTLRPRVGFAMNNWLVYATGGLVVGHEKVNETSVLAAGFTTTNSFSTTAVGWTVGAGVEYGLNRNWSIKAEYLYVDLGTPLANSGVLTPTIAGYSSLLTSHLTMSIARGGVNYRW